MKFALRCLRAAVILFFGALALLGGAGGIVNSVILLRAQAWPHIPSSVEQCELTRRYGKSRSTWEAHAVFRYGAGQSGQYDTTWQPVGSPVYERHPDPEVSVEQIAAMTATYCAAAANDGLRVSPAFPGIARRNEAVVTGTWRSELGFGVLFLLMGLMLSSVGIALLPWIEDRKRRKPTRKARPSRDRARRS
ncbi:hypothetical protein [Burkholderia stagnalis]|uniref:hypothetical protein n=1 Tax=Burkholderia stagnalis TaxID=1503054 RepID=UPI00075C6A22|nr:hypothetical protein [Burkholderia stagnalis]KVC59335.1 hypothetical protein WS59_20100 [Burkholderia stagnalis]KVN22614.1 hypothetical protein WT10_08435 [Burkholderia stagnalis]KWI76677.1 hypothetical protein WT75_04915 [Burkholderia stagnalis]KWK65427.1 hypothetical protein WT82_20030 [Burkholderia stagnalis]KWN21423.1 hypothetical protein WT84_12610 [Burkholderia stagnalis]